MVEYSKQEQLEALEELQQKDVPRLKEWIKDYKVMRDQVRTLR